ncbi:hypothetical protein MRX96_021760 [Rhipicephalus microplus]
MVLTDELTIPMVQGSQDRDERGRQVIGLVAAASLVVMNDPQSEPTYEMAYAASGIDRTVATPSFLSGYVWIVRSDVTHSGHKNIAVRIGSVEAGARICLT